MPQAVRSRIKRIEVYGQPADAVVSGQCAAINLGHCDAKEVSRGDVLTLPDYFQPEEFYACRLLLLPLEKISLKSGAELKFHTGTSEVNATLYPLASGDLHGNTMQIVQFRLKRPIVAAPGDPFIVRSFSPVRTIGGGAIIEAIPRRLKRNRPEIENDLTERAAAATRRRALRGIRHTDRGVGRRREGRPGPKNQDPPAAFGGDSIGPRATVEGACLRK